MSAPEVLAFVGRRLLVLPALLLVISFAVFSLTYLAPGSTEQALLGGRQASPQALEALRREYSLDDPFVTQYATWLSNAVRFDFGRSVRTSEPVADAIERRLGVTAFLAVYGFLITMLVGVPLGVLAAVRRRSGVDRAVVGVSVIGISAPAFATGIFLLYVFAIVLGLFPVFGQGEAFVDKVWHYTLPAAAQALGALALVVKLTRAAMIDALEQDYIAFARARGVGRRRVLLAHGLRNALVSVITASGLILVYLLTGAVLVETTFALPGVGSLLVESARFKDVPVIQALAMIVAVLIVLVNLLADLLYLAADPRIRFGAAPA
jgi:peptide/nickel transport system permease protein